MRYLDNSLQIIAPELVGGSLANPTVIGIDPIRNYEQPVYNPIINPQPVYQEPVNVSFPVYSGGIKEQLPFELIPIIEPTQPTIPVETQPVLVDLQPISQPIKGSGASAVQPDIVDVQIGGVIPPKTETPTPQIPLPILGSVSGGAGGGAGAGDKIQKQLGKNWFWIALAVVAGVYLISRKNE